MNDVPVNYEYGYGTEDIGPARGFAIRRMAASCLRSVDCPPDEVCMDGECQPFFGTFAQTANTGPDWPMLGALAVAITGLGALILAQTGNL